MSTPKATHLILNQVVGKLNNTTFVIPVKRFQKKYGYLPSLKTCGSKFRDYQILTKIACGEFDVEKL